MILYFLRHADAEDLAKSDHERKLTPKGLEQSEKTGKFCVRNGLIPEVVLTSPVVRAQQTAEIVAAKFGEVQLIRCPWLACGMSLEICLSELEVFSKFSQILLVGHEPDFGCAIASLIGLPSSTGLNIRKSSLTCVEISRLSMGGGTLQFSVPVRLM